MEPCLLMVKYILAFSVLKNVLSLLIRGATRVIPLNKKYYCLGGGG